MIKKLETFRDEEHLLIAEFAEVLRYNGYSIEVYNNLEGDRCVKVKLKDDDGGESEAILCFDLL